MEHARVNLLRVTPALSDERAHNLPLLPGKNLPSIPEGTRKRSASLTK